MYNFDGLDKGENVENQEPVTLFTEPAPEETPALPQAEEGPQYVFEGLDNGDDLSPKPSPEYALEQAKDFDPELVATGRMLGFSPAMTKADPEAVRTAARRREEGWETLRRDFPGTAEFLDFPDNAALAHKDVSSLKKIEKFFSDYWNPEDRDITVSGTASAGAGGVIGSIGSAIRGMGEAVYSLQKIAESNLRNSFGAQNIDELLYTSSLVSDVLVGGFLSILTGTEPENVFSETPGLKRIPEATDIVKQIGSDVESYAKENFEDSGENAPMVYRLSAGLADLASQAGMSLINPQLAVAYFAALGADQQAQAIDKSNKNISQADRARAVLLGMPVTAVTEQKGLERILKALPKTGRGGVGQTLKDLGGAGLYELGQEQAEGLIHAGITGATTGEEQDPWLSPEQALDIFLVGAVARGGSVAIQRAATSLAEKELTRLVDTGAAQNAEANALLDTVQSSSVAQNARDAFTEFMGNIDTNEIAIYLPREEVQRVIDTVEATDAHDSDALTLLRERLEESLEGDKVAISADEAASTLFVSDIAEQFREHMTMSPDAVAPSAAEQERVKQSTFASTMVEQAMQRAVDEAEARQIFREALAQMKESSLLSAADHRLMAKVIPAWAAAKAAREGTTPLQVLEDSGFIVRHMTKEHRIAFDQAAAAITREEDGSLSGLPRIREASAFPPAIQAAKDYMAAAGMEYRPPAEYAQVDVARARRIADEYERAEHKPNDPEVQAAYRQMAKETLEQFKAILATGLKIELIPEGLKDPYAETPRMATEDVRNNNHLWVYSTRAGFGTREEFNPEGNPLLEDSGFTDVNGVPMLANDVFRAVHDYFGHVKEGVGFRADGEENAWRAHAAMYSPLARRAMTTETRGQNSWLNFGPYGERNRTAKPEDTVFGDQKTTLLPEWVSEEGVGTPDVEALNQRYGLIRGRYLSGRGIIELSRAESRTTFLHEMAHFMLDMEPVDGPVWGTVRKWLGEQGLASFAKEIKDNYAFYQDATSNSEARNPMFTKAMRAMAGSGLNVWGMSFTDRREWDAMYGDDPSKFYPEPSQIVDTNRRVQVKIRDRIVTRLTAQFGDMGAIRSETWQHLYQRLSEKVGPQIAGQALAAEGVSGFTYDLQGTQVTTIWDSRAVDPTRAHDQYTKMRDLADFQQSGIYNSMPDGVTDEHIAQYLHRGSSGNAVLDNMMLRSLHEKFARGFEKYLMEGKAPTAELQETFRNTARWAADLYAEVEGDSLSVELNDTVRDLYVSLLTTPAQIQREAERSNIEELFTDAAMAGMTQAQYDKYLEERESDKEKAEISVREKIVGLIKARMTQQYKQNVKDARAELEEEVRNDRLHKAREALKGPLRLDFSGVADLVGEETLNADGEPVRTLPNRLRGMTKKGGEGVDPEAAAELLGYPSAQEMLNDVINGPTFSEDLSSRAEAAAEAKMGGLSTQEHIQEMVERAVRQEVTEKEVLAQLHVLRRSPEADERDRIKQMAKEMIGKMPISRISPARHSKAAERLAKEAAAALREGNRELAAQKKRQQYMHLQAENAAKKALADAKSHRAWIESKAKNKNIVAMAKRGGGFAEQYQKVLKQFGFLKGDVLPLKDDTGLPLSRFVKHAEVVYGNHIILSKEARLAETFDNKKEMSPDQLQGLVDTLKSLEKASKYHVLAMKAKEQSELNELVGELGASLEGRKPRHPIDSDHRDLAEMNTWDKIRKKISDWVAQNTKVSWMMKWMDGKNIMGVWHQTFTQPLTDAYLGSQKLLGAVAMPIHKALRERSEADYKRHRTKRTVTLPDGTKLTLQGHQILHLAMHLGNAEGRRKVQQGFRMVEEGGDPNAISPAAQEFLNHMTESDWDLVKTVWAQLDLLYPKIAESAERITGQKPPKVEPMSIETPFGVMTGGYVPLKKHRSLAEKAADADKELNEMFSTDGMYNAVGVDTSSRYERTDLVYEVDLNLNGITEHVREAVHFITHFDAIRSINRLIRDPRVERMVREHLSDADFEMLLPWLVSVARDGRESHPGGAIHDIMNHLRLGTTMVAMGFKASTTLMQGFGLLNSAQEVGAGNLLKGLMYFTKSPSETESAVQFALSRSRILQSRMATMDRELANAMGRVSRTRAGRALDKYRDAAFAPIAYMQLYAVDLPTWHGAYNKIMKESGDSEKAAQYADWVVENIQGSGRVQTASQIMRSKNEVVQTMTMFMTFFSALFNQTRDLSQRFHNDDLGAAKATSAFMFMFVLPVVGEMLLKGDWPDDEDDEYTEVIANLLAYPFTMLPIVRDVMSSPQMLAYITGERSQIPIQTSPVGRTLADTGMFLAAIPKALDGDVELSQRDKEAVARALGAWLHLPGVGQGVASNRHLVRWLEEGEAFSPRQLMVGADRQK